MERLPCALSGQPRHSRALRTAGAAGFRAASHLGVVGKALAITRTGVADRGARRARLYVQWRAAQHEARAGLADIDAVLHDANVVALGMRPAPDQTVLNRREADNVALLAQGDTALHRAV